MVRRILLFTTFLPLWILSSCAATFQGSPARLSDSLNALKKLDPYYAEVLKDYYEHNGDPVSVRNRFIETRLAVIDAQYLTFKQSLYQEGVSTNMGLDVATLGLNLAGTLTPAASAKAILAAISGGLIGTRVAAEKNLYFEKTMTAILAQMEALRKTARLEILKRMQLGVDRYPLSQAEYDLQEYYTAGTIPGAIVGVTMVAVQAEKDATGSLANEIKARLEKEGFTVSGSSEDESGKILYEFIKPSGKLNRLNTGILESWMSHNRVTSSVLNFINSDRYGPERKNAVSYLKKEGYLTK